MERLTIRLVDEPDYIPDEDAIYLSDEFGAKCWIGYAVSKLADYEDTGLTPEEINQKIRRVKELNCSLLRKDGRISTLKARLDAAIEDMKCNTKCSICAHFKGRIPCRTDCGLAYTHFKWRGLTEKEKGE